jgi:hypothetical protein
MKKQPQKLNLNRETLLSLDARVTGGAIPGQGFGNTFTCYFSCAESCSPGGTTIQGTSNQR